MGTSNHIISKQVFEIELSGIDDSGQVVQSEITTMFYDQLQPAMERVLDQNCEDGDIIRIDKLVLDVGTIHHQQLEAEFTKAVIEKLNSRLTVLLFTPKHKNQLKVLNKHHTDPAVQTEVPEIISSGESLLSSVLFFLDTGHLPWFYTKGDRQSQRPGGLLLKLFDSIDDPVFWPLAKKLAQAVPFRRFIYQLTDKEIYLVIQNTVKRSPSVVSHRENILKLAAFSLSLLSVFQKLQIATLTGNAWRLKVWQIPTHWLFQHPQRVKETPEWLKQQIVVLLQLVADESIQTQNTFAIIEETASSCMPILRSNTSPTDPALITLLSAFVTQKPSWKTAVDRHPPKTPKHQNADGKTPLSPPETVKHRTISEQLSDNDTASDGSNVFREEEKLLQGVNAETLSFQEGDLKGEQLLADPVKIHPANNSESYYIGNAGAVILHPFIKFFFEKLGLTQNKEFLSEEARQRAVHLLQYLITGQSETSEEQLFFNKLLCGIVTNEPIVRGINITQVEKDECQKLLEHVIGQWSVLKKTSPETLRLTFLQRDGVIRKDMHNSGWKLTVKRTAMDVLLDKLPWGISIIKMPWNPYLIHVEW